MRPFLSLIVGHNSTQLYNYYIVKRDGIIPNKAEIDFLTVSYRRFYKIFDEIMTPEFWKNDEWYRLSRIKEGFAVYAELLDYLPIKWTINYFRKVFPPEQAEIAESFIKFVRNIFVHFPLFDRWEDIYITGNLATWSKSGQINTFLKTYQGKQEIKFRFWEPKFKKMTYISIKFPKLYNLSDRIYLKNMMEEEGGIKFCFILMRRILDTQLAGSISG